MTLHQWWVLVRDVGDMLPQVIFSYMQCKSPNSDTSGPGQFALIRMQLKNFRLVKFLMQNILGTRMRTKTAVHTATEMKFMNFFTLFFVKYMYIQNLCNVTITQNVKICMTQLCLHRYRCTTFRVLMLVFRIHAM